ncbi:glycosyltransferase involved in cell wall biosynthesis/CDP-glycerol glycerophosphotransferase (TagB/SpsB family) [Paenibacillus forsythiae]|uniref:Glycosyltransferase involved in cell wall biosynthesis/CDP-glycerol glycerophosphotransferase (TagB/SpsB family) n=1 Tax=Paenibacillus forsythiae TaxID=365616 RepID=A0ABU3HGR9_9BACL|nr:glycosyltransferase [Paenibacillus forsythiae]MDT3428865.1 glycosyltransferase involved in cell wall biosynthesis/CDP-glycerol glycerophosphotransferase (TagB/SpsB family) [Paenibacillus forsythiae]
MKYVPVSVIITNYNKGKYLTECLLSVLDQSLSNLEIILVDDGSTDNSHIVIEELLEKYSSLKVIRQSNQGVSSARNIGMLQASGEYITFLDADDYVNKDAYRSLYLLAQRQRASIAIGNIRCFNESRSWSLPYLKPLFDRRKSVVRNIRTHNELNLSPSVGNKLFSRNLVVQHGIFFDEELYIGEDLLFTQACSHLSARIAVMEDVILNYRVNEESNTLSSKPTLSFFEQLLLLQSKIKQLYASMQVANYIEPIEKRQLKFLLKSMMMKAEFMNEESRMALMEIATKFLSLISADRFKSELTTEEQLLLEILKRKSSQDFDNFIALLPDFEVNNDLIRESNCYYYSWYNHFQEYRELLQVRELTVVSKIEIAELKGQTLYLGGYAFIKGLPAEGIRKSLVFRNNTVTHVIPLRNCLRTDITYLFSNNRINYNDSGFEIVEINLLELLGEGSWNLFLNVKKDAAETEIPVELALAQLRNSIKPKVIQKINIKPEFMHNRLNITLEPIGKMSRFKFKASRMLKDARYDISFLKSKDFDTFISIMLHKLIGRFLRRRQIWLVGERKDTAQDNSFHFYKYVRTNHPGVHAYYVIDKKAEDYSNISSLGNVIQYGSLRHTLYLLTCHCSINSYLESANFYTESYKKIIKYYPEWRRNKKVFLQHGVIGVSRVNHSLHKNKTDYSLFITSSAFEKDHITKEFGFTEDEVAITGLARWDGLQDSSKGNEILLMPTWRNWIKSRAELENSRYFKTYLSLLQNRKLHDILEDMDLTLTFYPHYQIQKVLSELPVFHERIKVVRQGEEAVQELLNRHALLITDYSTVSFDFAYMNKPVLFYQFDYEEFYSRHYNEGPIDHERDLFGEVVKAEVELLNQIAAVNDWIKHEKMKKSGTFMIKSRKHCEQIYIKLLQLLAI